MRHTPSTACANRMRTLTPRRRGKSAKVANFGMQGFKKQKQLEKNASGGAHPHGNQISKKKPGPPRQKKRAPAKKKP